MRVLFDSKVSDADVRKTVFAQFAATTLLKAVEHVTELASPQREEEAQA